MTKPKRHLITAALPYANGPIHIGHIAGAFLPADTYVKYLRERSEEVLFVCGSDEHGAAITLRAKAEGISPQEIVDKYHGINAKVFEDLGFDFDIYHRTSSDLHIKTAQEFFLDLNAKGVFEKKTSEQFYDEDFKQFLADRYLTGECPKCGHKEAYGDQCENCGSSLSPLELINPKSTLSGKTPVLKSTEHYYLPMNKYQEWVEDWVSKGKNEGVDVHDPGQWKKHVLGQCLSWLKGGLRPRAMTRDLDWGVPVPVEGAEGKVLYVWLDAPIGYISASKAWAEANGTDWEKFWKDENTELIHFIGKDNIVFHCIIFPILLKAKGDFILPKNIPANEFLNLEGQKISTSRNWAIWVHEYIQNHPTRLDELRFVLNAIAPETKDSEFTWADYQARINNELVAIYGNFVNRTLVLTNKYFQGVCPDIGELGASDQKAIEQILISKKRIERAIEGYNFREAQAELINLARHGNKYLADEEPWKLIKHDEERVKEVLYTAIQISAALSVLSAPFLPNSSKKLKTILGLEASWDKLGTESLIASGAKFEKPELLFEKIDNDFVEFELQRMQKSTLKKESKLMIEFDDFTKLDLRVAEIISAEKHPNADKLLVLKMNLGDEQRTVVSGIAELYKAEDLKGKKVTMLTNLAPRKIRGVESQGMILMAEDEKTLSFLEPSDTVVPGSSIR